jgi:hypothetical protein
MTTPKLHYVRSDVYLVHEDYVAITPIKPNAKIVNNMITLDTDGTLTVRARFDFSASFPAINTPDAIRAACEHDAFYMLMKLGLLSRDYREAIDYFFYNRLLEDGMPAFRALYWWKTVRVGGEIALNSPAPEVRTAPQPYQPVQRSVHFPYLPVNQ